MPAPPISIQPPCQLMSTSTLGSVNGKNDGPEADVHVAAEEAAGEQPQHALQVGHRHVAIDQQAFDLVEHRDSAWRRPCRADRRGRSEMIRTGGGVFSITRICTVLVWLRSKAATGGRPVDVGSPPARPVVALMDVQVEVFQRIAGRVLGRDVQGLEVVPLVLDLRPLGHGEPQPAHDLLQLLDRLRDRVQMAQAGADAGHRGIEPSDCGSSGRDAEASRSCSRLHGPLRSPA